MSHDHVAQDPDAEQPKQWKELSSHLRMRSLLLSGPFRLSSRSSEASTTLTFLPDGAIGIGQTYRTARWQLSNGKLELLDIRGAVQCRFVPSNDGLSLTQVQDGAEQSVGKLELVRVEAGS